MNALLNLQQIRDILYGGERNYFKTPERITSFIWLQVILFKMHERDTSTKKEFDTVLQMTLEYVLT